MSFPFPPNGTDLSRSFIFKGFLLLSIKNGKVFTLDPPNCLIAPMSEFLNKSAYSGFANVIGSSFPDANSIAVPASIKV